MSDRHTAARLVRSSQHDQSILSPPRCGSRDGRGDQRRGAPGPSAQRLHHFGLRTAACAMDSNAGCGAFDGEVPLFVVRRHSMR